MILQAIIDIITATEQIYAVVIPQGVNLPACTAFIVGDKPNPTKQEVSKLNFITVQISTFAKTYKEAAVLDNAIKTELDGYSGTFEGQQIYIEHNNSIDLYEDQTRVYHRASDYIIYKKS